MHDQGKVEEDPSHAPATSVIGKICGLADTEFEQDLSRKFVRAVLVLHDCL